MTTDTLSTKCTQIVAAVILCLKYFYPKMYNSIGIVMHTGTQMGHSNWIQCWILAPPLLISWRRKSSPMHFFQFRKELNKLFRKICCSCCPKHYWASDYQNFSYAFNARGRGFVLTLTNEACNVTVNFLHFPSKRFFYFPVVCIRNREKHLPFCHVEPMLVGADRKFVNIPANG